MRVSSPTAASSSRPCSWVVPSLFHSIPRRERNPTQTEIDSDDAYWAEYWDEDMSSDEEYNREWDEYYELLDAPAKQLEQQPTHQHRQVPKQPQGDKQQRQQAKGSYGGKQRKEVIVSRV